MSKTNKHIKLKGVKGKRLNVFVLFLLLSFLISLLVKLSDTYTHTLRFELQPTQLESNEVLISKEAKTINVTISGKGFELLKYYIEARIIDVDFSQLNKNKSHYFWTERSQFENVINHFDSKISVKSINPDTLLFQYDPQFIKKVPVQISVNSSFASGFDLVTPFQSIPDSITLTGPKSLLETISSIQTKTLKLKALNSNIDREVALDIPNASKQITYSDQVVRINVEVDKFTEGSIQVPVTVVNVPDSLILNFFPKEITVIFYTSLKAYSSIDASHFSIESDFNALTTENKYLNPLLVKQPSTVKTAKLKSTALEYVITPKND
jgi:YbbR domain-containing protein